MPTFKEVVKQRDYPKKQKRNLKSVASLKQRKVFSQEEKRKEQFTMLNTNKD